ncbi:DUF202 domain-containing protein [Candidatus Omnitrophota bacterium]
MEILWIVTSILFIVCGIIIIKRIHIPAHIPEKMKKCIHFGTSKPFCNVVGTIVIILGVILLIMGVIAVFAK